MNIDLENGEQILKQGLANHFKGIEGVGGKLFATNHRIYFSSHSINIQVHDMTIPYSSIEGVETYLTGKIIPNGLKITLKDGSKQKFVVWRRKQWVELIQSNL